MSGDIEFRITRSKQDFSSAVWAVTLRRSLQSSFTCLRWTPMASASAAWVRPSGRMNSSVRISPTVAGLRLVVSISSHL